jgi:hypothetical protein
MKNRGPKSRDVAALIDTLKSEGRASRAEESREDHGKRFREYVTIVLLGATLLAVCWQVREMIKVYEPIQRQADALKVSADAEKVAADAAQKQADNSEKAFTLGQRAWVGPTNATLSEEPKIGKAIEVAIQYQNSGREPALGFVNDVHIEAVNSQDNNATTVGVYTFMVQCGVRKAWQGGQVVYPSAFTNATLTSKSAASTVDAAVLAGKKDVLVQGCFHYRTMSESKFSYFCYFYRAGTTKIQNLNICQSGHDAD